MSAPTTLWLAEAEKTPVDLAPFVNVAWTDGTTGRFAISGFSAADESFDGRLVDVSDVTLFSFGIESSDVAPITCSFTVVDFDGAIAEKLYGATDARRSAVTMRQGGTRLSTDDWWTFFTGIVVDWSILGNRTVRINCATDSKPFDGDSPVYVIRAPSCPVESKGKFWPFVFGRHDAQNLSSSGALTAVAWARDATNGYRYVATRGLGKDVPRVYKNGAIQTLTTHYTISNVFVDGGWITSIDFVSATTAADVITYDADGLTTDWTSTGDLNTNPALQEVQRITIDVTNGAVLLDSSSWNLSASVLAGYYARGAYVTGGTIGRISSMSRLNLWLRSWPMLRAGWTTDGKLGLYAMTLCHPEEYIDAPWLDGYLEGGDHDLGQADFSPNARSIAKTVDVSYIYAADKYWATTTVQDPSVTERVGVSIQMTTGPAEF